MEAEIDKARFCRCDFRDARRMHIKQDSRQIFGDLEGWATKFLFSGPLHHRYGVVAETGLSREAQIDRELLNIELNLFLCEIASNGLFDQRREIVIKILWRRINHILGLAGYCHNVLSARVHIRLGLGAAPSSCGTLATCSFSKSAKT